ncbi:c6 transcription [Moniliophthora roreri]|nr:c6 transcription [Moniliophthora roreri]
MESEGSQPKKRFVKSHTKSRSGCLTCKQRRVKCDEVHPICGSCNRRNTDCVWPDSMKSADSPTSQSEEPSLPLVRQSHNPSPSPSSQLLLPSMLLDMTSLKLMHHYSLVTSTTLQHNPSALFVHQFVIPGMAFREPPIMHALFALTSIHLHSLYHPLGIADQDYLSLARRHKNEALTLSLAPNYVPLSPDSRMLARNFLIVYKLAEYLGVSDGPPAIFSLIDTVRDALRNQDHFYRDEQLQPLNWPFSSTKIVPTEAEEEAFASSSSASTSSPPIPRMFPPFLKQLHLPSAPYPDPEELLDPEVSAVYKQCISALRDSWYICQYHPGTGLSGTAAWIIRMTDRFQGMLALDKYDAAWKVDGGDFDGKFKECGRMAK